MDTATAMKASAGLCALTTAFHMNTDLAIDAYFPGHKAEGKSKEQLRGVMNASNINSAAWGVAAYMFATKCPDEKLANLSMLTFHAGHLVNICKMLSDPEATGADTTPLYAWTVINAGFAAVFAKNLM
eukprot:gene6969-22070_t